MWKQPTHWQTDIHSTKLWTKYIAPVVQAYSKVGITISPPKGMDQDKAVDIHVKVSEILQYSHTKSYFILESDKDGRWHWHGMLGFSKCQVNMGFDRKVMDQIKDTLKNISFVDYQTPLRSISAWINYTLKDIHFVVNQDSHCRMGKRPPLPRFEFHMVEEDFDKTLFANPDVIALINEPREVDNPVPE